MKQQFKENSEYCQVTGAKLPENPSLFDVDRIVERFNGGEYAAGNVRAISPIAHMKRHGNHRERDLWLEELKSIMDDRFQTMKIVAKINNQLLAYKRQTDYARKSAQQFLDDTLSSAQKRLARIDYEVEKHIKGSDDPLVSAALGVPGVGPVTVAGLQVYVVIEKAKTASSLWAYIGIDKASHSRYTKGEAGGGNKTLRSIIWNTANSMIKNRECPYRSVYDHTKGRLSSSDRIVKTRNTQGQLVECAWKDTKPSHRHGAALRAVMKHFLADYWFVARCLSGLDARPLYVEEKMGHAGMVKPVDRGWIF